MSNVFLTVLNMSVTAAFVIAALCLARLVLKKIRAPKWISYALWAVAGFRLVIPFSFESIFSLLPFTSKPVPSTAIIENVMPFSALAAGYHAIGDAVNGGLGTVTMRLEEPGYITTTEAYHSQVWLTLFQYVWVLGIVAMLLYAFISYMRLMRRKDSVTTPFVYGFIRPKIHIPNGLDGEELRYVTLHEQIHIKRHDHIVKMFAFAVLCVHWFNPFAWVAFMLLCADMEMSCDERVLSELGMSAKADYSQTLLSLSANRRMLNASPLAFGEGGIKERVKNVLKYEKASKVVVVAAVALAISLTIGLSLNRAVVNAAPDAPVQATITYERESAVIALDNKDIMPYVELGSTISLNFADSRPASVSVIEVRANANGSRKYGETTDRVLDVALSGSNLATFTVERNWADGLSSNSEDYLSGNSFRWYRIICEDGENSVEYGLWLRTDPAFIMNIQPNSGFDPHVENIGTKSIPDELNMTDSAGAPDDEISDGSYLWPLAGYTQISAPFGTRIHPIEKMEISHYGIDIAAPTGTPILAAKPGTVAEADKNDTDGLYILLDHGAGVQTFYAHMNEFAEGIASGNPVKKGDVIGYVGSTGKSTGSHLHFGISVDGNFGNPIDIFGNREHR